MSIFGFNEGGTTGTGTGTNIPVPTDPNVGQPVGKESSLSSWAGDYVTDMLGRGQALANQGYEAYTGPLSAGQSDIQNTAFQGIGNLTVPTNMGAFTPSSFTGAGAPVPQYDSAGMAMNVPAGGMGGDVASQYMNPYLQAALNPQLDEARRQSNISRLADAGRLTQAGAFGGTRQAIMESEGNRNLGQNLAAITGQGYSDAYDKALNQFNTEQGRQQTAQDASNRYGLEALAAQTGAGATQRGITAEGIAADRAQFEEERDFPYKQVQYQQSLLQGLPLEAQTTSYSQPSNLSKLLGDSGGIMALLKSLGGLGGGSGSGDGGGSGSGGSAADDDDADDAPILV